eukprot:GHVP01021462.1.p1 GENE.GHVP01021462.1~~GHVP01021462.1.p1  ORF type:complete len:208 (+),score=56.34 GHVP01021462.1:274-897(+)
MPSWFNGQHRRLPDEIGKKDTPGQRVSMKERTELLGSGRNFSRSKVQETERDVLNDKFETKPLFDAVEKEKKLSVLNSLFGNKTFVAARISDNLLGNGSPNGQKESEFDGTHPFKRTIQYWRPEGIICKRFHVSEPKKIPSEIPRSQPVEDFDAKLGREMERASFSERPKQSSDSIKKEEKGNWRPAEKPASQIFKSVFGDDESDKE